MNKFTLALMVLSVFGWGQTASAHMLETNYALTLDTLELEATLSNGESFDGQKVVIYAPNDLENPWLESTTDEAGKFAFTPDPAIEGDWSIEIGEDSHWDNLIVPVDDGGIEINLVGSVPSANDDQMAFHPEYHNQKYFMVLGLGLIAGIGASYIKRS